MHAVLLLDTFSKYRYIRREASESGERREASEKVNVSQMHAKYHTRHMCNRYQIDSEIQVYKERDEQERRDMNKRVNVSQMYDPFVHYIFLTNYT